MRIPATATTFGNGMGLGAATSGAGIQIIGAGAGSSLLPASSVSTDFTRARDGSRSSRETDGATSGSLSRRLNQTIFFSWGRISWS